MIWIQDETAFGNRGEPAPMFARTYGVGSASDLAAGGVSAVLTRNSLSEEHPGAAV
jgi:hypothetical protein